MQNPTIRRIFMKRFTFAALLTAFTIFAVLPAPAHSQTAKQKDIVKLLKTMGTETQAAQMLDLVIQSMQPMIQNSVPPDVAAAFWAAFKSKFDANEFMNMLVPIYDKHFTHDDIKQLVKFYESPVGKKLIKVTPIMAQETAAAGQKWGERLGEESMKELMKQGYGK
jgi:hypothetical protein